MAEFLFHLELPHGDKQLKEEVPGQEDHINQLFEQGRVRSYSMAAGRTMLWCVVEADTEQEAMDIVSKFPVYPFCVDVVHHTLMLHQDKPYALPDISLN
ncbi:MAG: hypothetical protein EOP51_09605 [Sphingobacteriales bacterium]|nr:MAG: hypothetical protein EOP51_09605 [Sphingobacteriales bacterium]